MHGIKLLSVMTVITTLTACEGKPLRLHLPALQTINDRVCLLIPAENDEYLNLIEISSSDKSQSTFRKFISEDDKSVPLSRNKCVPLFDYPFKTGYAYGVSFATSIKRGAELDGRNFVISFTLYRVDGKLMATRI